MLSKLEEMLQKASDEAQEIGREIVVAKRGTKYFKDLIERNIRLMGRIQTLNEVIRLTKLTNTITGEC